MMDAGTFREHMVDQLIGSGRLRSEPLIEALRAVPRHVFVPGVELAKAYEDEAIATKWADDGQPISSSSQPAVMAAMLAQLGVEPGQRVLEIGAGTGYNAALMAHLVGESGAVTTLDIDEDLVDGARRHLSAAGIEGVRVVCADGANGWSEACPYDRIILTVGAWDLSPAWVDQLADGGRLVLPLSVRGVQLSVAFVRVGDGLTSVSIIGCGFMPLRGALAVPDSVRPLGDRAGVFLKLDNQRPVDIAALSAALRQPSEQIATGVTAGPGDVIGGLGLWVALHELDAGQLSAVGAAADRGLVSPPIAYPGWARTVVLVGTRELAALVRHPSDAAPADDFMLGVRSFGLDGDDLAERLVARVRDWERRGRPDTKHLRIRAHPRSRGSTEAAAVVDKHHYRLLLDWAPSDSSSPSA